VLRRHHPLYGREFEVLRGDKAILTIRLPDGSTMKIPRAWTDADGVTEAVRSSASIESIFTVEAVRQLIDLAAALRNRN
jgi:hypothetical protein